ncbi:MAG: hypothetical protein U5K56_11470 [Halioglobus sp.]|nr:hypothetical protein [Halioglobus sp.]
MLRQGVKIATLEANQFQAREVKSRLPRGRYVAFQMNLSSPLDAIEVVVSATGQKLQPRDLPD